MARCLHTLLLGGAPTFGVSTAIDTLLCLLTRMGAGTSGSWLKTEPETSIDHKYIGGYILLFYLQILDSRHVLHPALQGAKGRKTHLKSRFLAPF